MPRWSRPTGPGSPALGGSDAAVQLVLGRPRSALVLVGVPAVVAGQLDGVLLASVLILAIASAEAVGPLPMASRALVSAGTAAARLREVLGRPAAARPATRHVAPGARPAPGTPTPPTVHPYPARSAGPRPRHRELPRQHDARPSTTSTSARPRPPGRRRRPLRRRQVDARGLSVRFLDPDSGRSTSTGRR
jgi:hypothetical protein